MVKYLPSTESFGLEFSKIMTEEEIDNWRKILEPQPIYFVSTNFCEIGSMYLVKEHGIYPEFIIVNHKDVDGLDEKIGRKLIPLREHTPDYSTLAVPFMYIDRKKYE
jgi:hypothetical protein